MARQSTSTTPSKRRIVLLMSCCYLLLSGDWLGILVVHAQSIGKVDKGPANACLRTKSPSQVFLSV